MDEDKKKWISLLVNVLLLAIKYAPDVVDAVKDFIARLNQSDWTEEAIRALVEPAKPPEEY